MPLASIRSRMTLDAMPTANIEVFLRAFATPTQLKALGITDEPATKPTKPMAPVTATPDPTASAAPITATLRRRRIEMPSELAVSSPRVRASSPRPQASISPAPTIMNGSASRTCCIERSDNEPSSQNTTSTVA